MPARPIPEGYERPIPLAGYPYYRHDLALVHHLGFGFHADACAPGVLALLEPVRQRGGLIVELGCGSGLLTRHLLDAGPRVIATDASPAMLDLAREHAVGAEDIYQVVLPDDPLPPRMQSSPSVTSSTISPMNPPSITHSPPPPALRPGGVFAIDLWDLEWGQSRLDLPTAGHSC
jgi:SAM-dependent methyltransferase